MWARLFTDLSQTEKAQSLVGQLVMQTIFEFRFFFRICHFWLYSTGIFIRCNWISYTFSMWICVAVLEMTENRQITRKWIIECALCSARSNYFYRFLTHFLDSIDTRQSWAHSPLIFSVCPPKHWSWNCKTIYFWKIYDMYSESN